MADTILRPPPFEEAPLGGDGRFTSSWQQFIHEMWRDIAASTAFVTEEIPVDLDPEMATVLDRLEAVEAELHGRDPGESLDAVTSRLESLEAELMASTSSLEVLTTSFLTDRLTSAVGAGSTWILTDDSTNQIMTGNLGDMVFKQAGGDFSFGDFAEQPSQIVFRDAVFPFAGPPWTLYGTGLHLNRNSQRAFVGEIDMSEVGFGYDNLILLYPAGDTGVTSPTVQLCGPGFAALAGGFQFKIADGALPVGNDMFTIDTAGVWMSAGGGTIGAGGLSVTGDSIINGHLRLGASGAPETWALLQANKTFTVPNVENYGILAGVTVDPIGANLSQPPKGIDFVIVTDDTDSRTFGAHLTGGKFQALHDATTAFTGAFGLWGGDFQAGSRVANAGALPHATAARFLLCFPLGITGTITDARYLFLSGENDYADKTNLYGIRFSDLNQQNNTVSTEYVCLDIPAQTFGAASPALALRAIDKALFGAEVEIDGDLNHDGSNIGFFGVAPAVRAAAYTPSNVTPDRSYDADATTVEELADVLGTLIADLQTYGLLQ